MSDFKSNQVTFIAANMEFTEILFDEIVEFASGDSRRKIQALFYAVGNEGNDDMLSIVFWEKAADALAAHTEGQILNIKCKVYTRFIVSKNSGNEIPITEVVGFFVQTQEKAESERNKYERERPSNNRRESTEGRNSRNQESKTTGRENRRTRPVTEKTGDTGKTHTAPERPRHKAR